MFTSIVFFFLLFMNMITIDNFSNLIDLQVTLYITYLFLAFSTFSLGFTYIFMSGKRLGEKIIGMGGSIGSIVGGGAAGLGIYDIYKYKQGNMSGNDKTGNVTTG